MGGFSTWELSLTLTLGSTVKVVRGISTMGDEDIGESELWGDISLLGM